MGFQDTMRNSHGCTTPLIVILSLTALFLATALGQVAAQDADRMVFLQHCEPRFREGLRKHGLLAGEGYRLHNTGMKLHRFGDQWKASPILAEAQNSGRLYYFDRITGGMPYQSLDGITDLADTLKGDPNFLGFQVHEWGNSPLHDYDRIHRLILDKGHSFDKKHFAPFEGRVASPYFSGGDYGVYHDLFEELESLSDVERYLERYFKKLLQRTSGQVMSVTGYGQLHHAALRLGAKNVMPEIGNQVPLSALQIAFARGAAREFGKPFGVYYEPWGGSPMGCVCALPFSPWFPSHPELKKRMDGYRIGPEFGSSRSLQRRLLYFSWLSGAAFYGEEWGAENYFADWQEYPLTEYGKIIKEFDAANRRFARPKPVVPAALVMPPDTFGVDIRYVAGYSEKVWRIAPCDPFHTQLRSFARQLYATQPVRAGADSHNLTPSPWIGCFDVLSSDATGEILEGYSLLVYFDANQAARALAASKQVLVYESTQKSAEECGERLDSLLAYRVEGRVGCAHARSGGSYLLGISTTSALPKRLPVAKLRIPRWYNLWSYRVPAKVCKRLLAVSI